MKTKELTEEMEQAHWDVEILSDDLKDEIIQRLLEFDELKKMITDVVDPLIELCKYSAKNFQKGDINYGRNK